MSNRVTDHQLEELGKMGISGTVGDLIHDLIEARKELNERQQGLHATEEGSPDTSD